MVITPLIPGFHAVVHAGAERPKDRLHVVNDLQRSVLERSLAGGYTPVGEIEKTAVRNLRDRGLFSEKTGFSGHYAKNLSVWLHLTDQCPLRCTYCHVEKRDEHLPDPTLAAFADMLVRTAESKQLEEIVLRLAGGEPVLRYAAVKDWIDDTRLRLSVSGCELRIAMLSGLATLPTQVVEFAKNGGGISVSMDGLEEVQDRTRPLVNGTGSFEKVRKNLGKLRSAGVDPYVLVVVSNDNVDGLADFTEWLVSENLGFRYSFQKGGGLDRERVTNALHACYDTIERAVMDGKYGKFGSHRLADLSTFNRQRTACGAGRSSCSVYLDGSIYLCQMEHGNQVPLGYVTETSRDLCEILSDRVVRKGFHEPSNGCDGCEIRNHCAGGCPIDRKTAGGHNPNCELFRTFLPKIHRIHGLQKLRSILGDIDFRRMAA